MPLSDKYHLEYDKKMIHAPNKFLNTPRQSESIVIDILSDYIVKCGNPNVRILDIGCGQGVFTRHLKSMFPDAEIHGWDAAPMLMHHNALQYTDIQWLKFNCFEDENLLLPYRNYFDIIISFATTQVLSTSLPNWQDPLNAIEYFFKIIAQVSSNGALLVNFDGYHSFPEYDVLSYSYQVSKTLKTKCADTDFIESQIYNFPSQAWLLSTLYNLGYTEVSIKDFRLVDVQLSYNGIPGETYTKESDSNNFISMLGILEQPWAHVVAKAPTEP